MNNVSVLEENADKGLFMAEIENAISRQNVIANNKSILDRTLASALKAEALINIIIAFLFVKEKLFNILSTVKGEGV